MIPFNGTMQKKRKETEMKIKLSEKHLINVLKDLLCAPDEWHAPTKNGKLVIRIKAKKHRVQKEIFDWLSVAKRKQNFLRKDFEEFYKM